MTTVAETPVAAAAAGGGGGEGDELQVQLGAGHAVCSFGMSGGDETMITRLITYSGTSREEESYASILVGWSLICYISARESREGGPHIISYLASRWVGQEGIHDYSLH